MYITLINFVLLSHNCTKYSHIHTRDIWWWWFPPPAESSAAFPSLMSLPVFSTVRRVHQWILWTNVLYGDLSTRPWPSEPATPPCIHVSFQCYQYKGFKLWKFIHWLSIDNWVCINQTKAWVTWPSIMYIYHLIIYIFLCLNLFSNHLFLYFSQYITHITRRIHKLFCF